ncbi:hypothetical protein [Lactococcus lactis]|uniref:Uncharacterized protein n=1 Tax=Lactococcus lactis TaxID=1358 RepID=A0AAP4DTX5_9LACT|nr:hypothetical protein [Lactococcus lactis]MDG4968260.1 hypothetical protein [Lactococcus lactis]MDG4976380.1 hypothetical protein [Lactococcus lactis]MDG5102184.1 hypothetical protein [Lactococcus lactis]
MNEIPCESCEKLGCHGECENYILQMIEHDAERDAFDRLFKEIPKFNYVLNEKINAIFGTDLEVAKGSEVDKTQTEALSNFLYSKNKNRNTNLFEIKRAIKEKEIFGEGYLFFDSEGRNVYALAKSEITEFQEDEKNPIIDNILYYTVGTVDVPDKFKFETKGFFEQESGYIISPENMIKFKSDSYALNSDLRQLQILLDINRKIYESTTKRDYGDLFLFTTAVTKDILSAVAKRVKDKANETIKKMRERVAKLIKRNKVDDSNVIVLDENYKSVEQIKPVTMVKDYQFIWEKQDDIITSVFNFPMLLAGLGDGAGNVSKEALLKEARANTLTPIKADTANALTDIAKKLCGEEYYLRFKDYSEVNVDYNDKTVQK